MFVTIVPDLNTIIGLSGLCLCVLNYKLLCYRRSDDRSGLYLVLNHAALGCMATGLMVNNGFGALATLGMWSILALLAVPARRVRVARARPANRLLRPDMARI